MKEELKWHHLPAGLEQFTHWTETTKNSGRIRNEHSIFQEPSPSTSCIVSWRWAHSDPIKNLERLSRIRAKVFACGFEMFMIDLVSVDQENERRIEQVIDFSRFYNTLPVVTSYPSSNVSPFQHRGWIIHETVTW